MPSAAQLEECVQKYLNDFRQYDKAVDVVSCWQFLFTEVQPLKQHVLWFDRFPRLVPTEPPKDPKTPDFALLASDAYGIVADIKSGFPLDDKDFLSHARRLLKYDQKLSFRSGAEGRSVAPTDHDILLLIPYRDASQIVHRIEKFRTAGDLKHERSLITLEWNWDSEQNEYVFRKVAGQTCDFQDSPLPADARLSSIFSESHQSLKISADKIKSIKATWQFCNDAPPPIYTIVFLWTKIFYSLLDSEQRQLWRRRDPRKTLTIQTNPEKLVKEIERRYPFKWGHWTDWIKSALDTLVSAGLAKKTATAYLVGYRNLAREIGEPLVAPDKAGHTPREFARILATYICKGAEAETFSEDTTDAQWELFRRNK